MPARPVACGIISGPLLYRIVGKPAHRGSPGGLLLFITKETTQQNHLTSGPHGPAATQVCARGRGGGIFIIEGQLKVDLLSSLLPPRFPVG